MREILPWPTVPRSDDPSEDRDRVTPSERALIDTALSFATRLGAPQACTTVLDAAERLYEARSSWILLHDAAADALVTNDFRGRDAETYALAWIPCASNSIAAIAFRERQPIFVPDVRAEERWFDTDRVRRSGLRSVFLVPLVCDDVAIGILGLDSDRFSAGSRPGGADTERLRALAAQAAAGIRNARLFDAIERDRRRLRRLLQERRQPGPEVSPLRREVEDANVLPFSEAGRRAIVHALESTGWRISGPGGAAEVLGLKPTTLHAKMKKLGIRRPSVPAATPQV